MVWSGAGLLIIGAVLFAVSIRRTLTANRGVRLPYFANPRVRPPRAAVVQFATTFCVVLGLIFVGAGAHPWWPVVIVLVVLVLAMLPVVRHNRRLHDRPHS